MGNLSEHFNIADFFTEGKKVQDMASFHIPDIYQRIKNKLVNPILQPMRYALAAPVVITSGYRSDAFNARLKNASPNSDHLFGGPDKSAVDIRVQILPSAWDWLKNNRSKFAYAYMDVCNPDPKKHWIHISGLKKNYPRVGRMWIQDLNGKHYEPDYDPAGGGKDVA